MKATDREIFEFDECWTCRLFGTGGLRIDRLFSAREKVKRFRPRLMMTSIGTHDIDAPRVTVSEQAKTVFRFGMMCMSAHAVGKVILCPVLSPGTANLIRMIQNIYDKATSAVYLNNSIGDWFRTTVGVRQGCVLFPTLFNIFLERIMTDALNGHEGTVSISGRNITSLRFADDVDGLAGTEEEIADLA